MPRLNIGHLPYPTKSHRPDLQMPLNGSASYFETEDDSFVEDRVRVRLLNKAADLATDPENRRAALALARHLDYESRGDDPPTSLASAAYMRELRVKFGGALWALADHVNGSVGRSMDGQNDPLVRTASVFRKSWEIPLAELLGRDPTSFTERLRVDMAACGSGKVGGGFCGVVHGEYNPATGIARTHIHGTVFGEMEQVFERMRAKPGYAPIERQLAGQAKRTPAIRMSRRPLVNEPSPYTYCLQSSWPGRWEGIIDGVFRRQAFKSRIPEPAHTQILIWLNQWSLSDLTLLVGMRATSRGLELTRPLYSKEAASLPKKQRQTA